MRGGRSVSTIFEADGVPHFTADVDAWLSAVMGCRVNRISRAAAPDATGAAAWAEALAAPGFSYAKLPCQAVVAAQRLEDAGFRYVDVGIVLDADRSAVPARATTGVRPATPQDEAAVAALATSAFRWSRFHLDPAVPNALANRIKGAWAANYFSGRRGDHMVVAEADGSIAGFLQLLYDSERRLVIDLIAVGSAWRGRGLASAMIAHAAAQWAGEAGLRVGTQLANRDSFALYQRLGFRLSDASLIFHRHHAVVWE